MATTAQTVSAMLDNDGSIWETEDGRSLSDLAAEFGGVEEREEHQEPELVPGRIEFPDGSAICYGDGGWDIEGSRPFLMSGLE